MKKRRRKLKRLMEKQGKMQRTSMISQEPNLKSRNQKSRKLRRLILRCRKMKGTSSWL
jgi:hypothetical protein